MNIQDALKETGKAVRYDNDPSYVMLTNGALFWYSKKDNSIVSEAVFLEYILGDNWQPYHSVEEIRPEKAGELWKCGDCYVHTEQADGEIYVCFMRINHTAEDSDIVHGKNWTRLFPPVEDENVERIEIEGVAWRKDSGSTLIYPAADTEIEWSDFRDKPRMKMILEIPKDKP